LQLNSIRTPVLSLSPDFGLGVPTVSTTLTGDHARFYGVTCQHSRTRPKMTGYSPEGPGVGLEDALRGRIGVVYGGVCFIIGMTLAIGIVRRRYARLAGELPTDA
jgi:hypothetical protein